MFPVSSSAAELLCYDFEKDENAAKWKGLFINPLRKVLEQVHTSLTAREDALEYVESLILRLLGMLCAKPTPHTTHDVEERVRRTFPTPIDRWALSDAREALDKNKKKKEPLVLPVDKIHNLLQKEVLQYKLDPQVSLFIVAVLEYISADILKLAGNYVKNIRHVEITCQDIRVAMCADKALMDMFCQDDDNSSATVLSEESEVLQPRTSLTYEEVVKELIQEEKRYLRDLHMIIKVFREETSKLVSDIKDLEDMFSNIMDIHELTVTLLGSLEDMVEIYEEKQVPAVGSCFEELAEAAEFDVYRKYASDMMSSRPREALHRLLSQPEVSDALQTAGQGFREAVKYYLPKLLHNPVWHCFLYLDYIHRLKRLTPLSEDRESFEQVEGLLRPLFLELGHITKRETSSAMLGRTRRQIAVEKTKELQRSIDGWEGKDIGHCCNEFIREDVLKLCSGKRPSERRVFLFDGLMILCKPTFKRTGVSAVAPQGGGELRLKERFFIRKVCIVDREDTDELKHAFEISPRTQPSVVLAANSSEEKHNWMADLIMVNTGSMLDRILDSILLDEEKKHPLRLPPPDQYKFSEVDSKENIELEYTTHSPVPLIKGATLYKLVERLTYHIYADPMFVRTFLTTYRSFCTPEQLLQLLIERFNIPEPPFGDEATDDKALKNSQREDWKRFRKEYCQPVQFRVLNVLRHWVDHHFYDFEQYPSLLDEVDNFLDSINGKSMRKWVDSVSKVVQRKRVCNDRDLHREMIFGADRSPPPIEWHIQCPEKDWNLLTLHPIELARQLTLLEFDKYRAVKPSELVNVAWTRPDKEKNSPNVIGIMKYTTNFTRWLEKIIVEAENFEERVAILTRILEMMSVLRELNNFNGELATVSAICCASVFRLKYTRQQLPEKLRKLFEEANDLYNGRLYKYQQKLRTINPPCVPFLGGYLTRLVYIEDGNTNCVKTAPQLINFAKRRKVAEITGEIQQYQNQQYCLLVEPRIRNFLVENIQPLDMTESELDNYLFAKSLEIEPRGVQVVSRLPRFPRRWPDLNLKSPGTKPKNMVGRSATYPTPLPAIDKHRSMCRLPGLGGDSETDSDAPCTPLHSGGPGTPPAHSRLSRSGDDSVFVDALLPRSPGPLGNLSPSSQTGYSSFTSSQTLSSFSSSQTASSFSSSQTGHSSFSPSPSPGTSPNPAQRTAPTLLPPPLPPRRNRETSLSDHTIAQDIPRDQSPPPLPPRGSLQRRNSALDVRSSEFDVSSKRIMSVNNVSRGPLRTQPYISGAHTLPPGGIPILPNKPHSPGLVNHHHHFPLTEQRPVSCFATPQLPPKPHTSPAIHHS